jgi:hypothetical protein
MTEAEWLACDDPLPMLKFMEGQVSDRKLRFFVAACCRRLWGASDDDATRVALEVAEHLAETGVLPVRRAVVQVAAGQAVLNCNASEPLVELEAWSDDLFRKRFDPWQPNRILTSIIEQTACEKSGTWPRNWWKGLVASLDEAGLDPSLQARLFREVIRGPFRPLLVSAAWHPWDDGMVPGIAQAAYEKRDLPGGELDPGRLAILSDALEDAGCTDTEILEHLRGPGPHVRGCWALDVILGKE